MSQSALVSVVIPAYNYAHYLPLAVESIIQQHCPQCALEIIVVDDGSTDATPQIARILGERIVYIRQENQGLSAARNTGLDAASGDFVLFLDADDLLAPDAIAQHLANFAQNPTLDISVCRCVESALEGEQPTGTCTILFRDFLPLHLCSGNIAPVHAFLIRTDAARRIGHFDTSLTACEDYDFWLRCAAVGYHFGIAQEGLVFYRKHAESMSRQFLRQVQQNATVILRAGEFLEKGTAFSQVKELRLAWLAQAWGCLLFACLLEDVDVPFAVRIGHAFYHAMVRAAACPPACTVSGELAEMFYAVNILSGNGKFAALDAVMKGRIQKALGIVKHLFPQVRSDEGSLRRTFLRLRDQCYLSPHPGIAQRCAQQGITLVEGQ